MLTIISSSLDPDEFSRNVVVGKTLGRTILVTYGGDSAMLYLFDQDTRFLVQHM